MKMMEKPDQFIGCVAWQNNAQKNQVLASGILCNSVGFSSKIGTEMSERKIVGFCSLYDQENFLQMRDFLPF